MIWTPKRLLVAFLLGAAGGALCDQIHVRTGTLVYPDGTHFLGQPLWVAPNFGVGIVAILLAASLFAGASWLREAERRPTPRTLAIDGALFVLAYLASGIFHEHPRELWFGLFGTWIARAMVRPDRRKITLFSLLLGASGAGYESLLSSLGLFHYQGPLTLGLVPLWLPGLYMHGAFAALDIGYALRERR